MTEPSQYFKGRTVQEQMNEVIGYVDVRSAEVATDAIAADVAQVHQDMLDADADAAAAAASAAAAAGTLANAVKKTGEASQSIAGDIAVSGALTGGSISAGAGGLGVGGHSALQDVTVSGNITVPTPTANSYAANKKYVDDADALNVHLAGNENITGNKTVPLEATETFSNQIASSNKVKNELDNYTPMMRTSGNQVFSGIKKASGTGFIRKSSASLNLANPPEGTVTDETYVLEDVNGQTVIQNFNSYTEGAQTIYQMSTKYAFTEGGVAKETTGILWLAVYADKVTLFLRFKDKNGSSHMKTILTTTEND